MKIIAFCKRTYNFWVKRSNGMYSVSNERYLQSLWYIIASEIEGTNYFQSQKGINY